MSKQKNYNPGAIMVELGLAPPGSQYDLDDMEIVEELGLDPKLAYTPGINEAAFQKTKENHMIDLVRGGYEPEEARKIANESMAEARATLRDLNKKRDNPT